MKPTDLKTQMQEHGWKASSKRMTTSDGNQKVTLWRREGDGPSDVLLTLEVDGEMQLFRANSRMPLAMVLSGKAPPA